MLNLLVISILLVAVGAGCQRNPKNITTIPGQERPDLRAGPADLEGANRLGQNQPTGIQFPPPVDPQGIADPMPDSTEDRVPLAPQTVYFDFDRFAIRPDQQPKLAEVANYLQANPSVQLKVEGYCDERGTEEYNRALGERRAIAAREFLIQRHNVDPGRITTVSFGEDRPADPGQNEEAYAKNRRAEFVVLKPQ